MSNALTVQLVDASNTVQTVSTLDAIKQDGSIVVFGSTTDAANTATGATSVSQMSVLKQISSSVQATAATSTALATAGNQITTQATTANIAISTANAAIVLGTKTDVANTATDNTALTAMAVWKQISASVQSTANSVSGGIPVPVGSANTNLQIVGNSNLATIVTQTVLFGTKTDTANTSTDATSVSSMSVWKQISKSAQAIATSVAGTLTVATHAVTQSGSWVLSAGSALIGSVKISDGTNLATIKAASTAPIAGDTSIVVGIHPSSINGNGGTTAANSAPVVNADQYTQYETVAASQTAQILGTTGAVGDYLAGVLCFPGAAGCGVVTILDNATTLGTFAGGGTIALPSLVPFMIPVGIVSASGAWKITTGANITVVGIGKFT